MDGSLISLFENKEIDMTVITNLYKKNNHAIYWLGIDEETAFRCNVYLIRDNDEYILVDPGSRSHFEQIKNRVSEIVDPALVNSIIVCHQDPDVAASIVDWLDFNPNISIISSARTNVLLPHYGKSDYNFIDIAEQKVFTFKSGNELKFIEAPFLHFSGAFTTYDEHSNFLFSGDIFAALDIEWELIVSDFNEHITNMDLFHIDYMASNKATNGYAQKIKHLPISAILPQHGSIINSNFVNDAIKYLENLQCGLDLLYNDLT